MYYTMNITLFISSCVFTYIHLITSCNSWIIKLLLLRGCITSLLNHSTSYHYLKLYDRIVMIETAIIKLYLCVICSFTFNIVLTKLAILFYLISKKYNRTDSHIIAHLLITMSNILFLDQM